MSVAMVRTSGIIRIRLCIKPLFHDAVNVKINCRHKAGFMDGKIIRWKIPSSEQPSIRADSTMLCKGIIFRYIRIKYAVAGVAIAGIISGTSVFKRPRFSDNLKNPTEVETCENIKAAIMTFHNIFFPRKRNISNPYAHMLPKYTASVPDVSETMSEYIMATGNGHRE